ncbi:hypothetical protein KKB3_00400 [Dehalococcoides mccartyi]|nr:hypothetical protein KKB3_00400 [Dehalococcoides mccartyi]
MYCTKCGEVLSESDNFCPKCGKDLSQISDNTGGYALAKPIPKYADIHGLSLAVLVTFGLLLIITIGSIISDYMQVEFINHAMTGSSISEADAVANDNRQAIFGMLSFIAIIVVDVLFLIWIHRAHKNLAPLGATELQYSPGWAVGGFFIPVANIFIPYQVTREIWKASAPDYPNYKESNWKNVRLSSVLGWWWALYLINNFVSWVMIRSSGNLDTLADIQAYTVIVLISDVILVPAIISAMGLVWEINNRQTQRCKAKNLLEYNLM